MNKSITAICITLLITLICIGFTGCANNKQITEATNTTTEETKTNTIQVKKLTSAEQDLLTLAGVNTSPVFLDYSVDNTIKSIILYTQAYQNGKLVDISGLQVLSMNTDNAYTGTIALSSYPKDNSNTINWSCAIHRQSTGSASTSSTTWETQLPNTSEYMGMAMEQLQHTTDIVAGKPIVLTVFVYDQDGDIDFYGANDDPKIISKYDYVYIQRCIFSTDNSDDVVLPHLENAQ
ncbi:MAG: hypothetical protein RR263_04835 [Oscillospiraceae bacterium]